MAVIANNRWDIHSFDVSAAYLQGKDMERNVYIRPPVIFCPDYNKCWLLKKGVYGLKDAGRLWYEKVHREIKDRGGTFVIGDAAFFFYFKNNELHGVGCLYVDDVFGGGSKIFHDDIFKPLITKFKVSKVELNSFKFCGLMVDQDIYTKEITISQCKYIDSIEPVPCTKNYTDEQKATLLRGVAGQLLYCALTRPDIMFDTADIVRVDKSLDEHWSLAKKLIEKTKSISVKIKFKRLGVIDKLHLALYTDACCA